MNAPVPSAPGPRVVLKNNAVRDALIAVACAVLILGVLGYAVLNVSKKPQGNMLSGKVVEKVFTPLKEEIVEFSGRKLKGVRESEGEYVLKVRVDAEEGRVFEVPVSQTTYRLKDVGDTLEFIRPRSEQK